MNKKILILLIVGVAGFYFLNKRTIQRKVETGLVNLVCNSEIIAVIQEAMDPKQKNVAATGEVQAEKTVSETPGNTQDSQESMRIAFNKVAEVTSKYVVANPEGRDLVNSIHSLSTLSAALVVSGAVERAATVCPDKMVDARIGGLAVTFSMTTLRMMHF